VVPPTTLPKIRADSQVSTVTGIAKAGNKVFKDHMVAIGPSTTTNMAMAKRRKTLVIYRSN
jgi:hypothetical protein